MRAEAAIAAVDPRQVVNTAGTPRTDAVSVVPSTTPVNVRPQSGEGVASTNWKTVPTTV